MDEQIKTWLYDILKSLSEIEEYFAGRKKIFADFVSDIKTKRAVERNLEIIGEAVGRILKTNDKIKISNARKIVDMRNRIIHAYDSISDENIWTIVIKHLPLLKKEIQELLKK